MISDRDRRILADIERQTRALDPELCDRLRGPGPGTGGGSRLLRRTTSTTAIVCWVLALVAAMALGLPLVSFLLIAALAVSATLRVWRDTGDLGATPGPQPPHWLRPR